MHKLNIWFAKYKEDIIITFILFTPWALSGILFGMILHLQTEIGKLYKTIDSVVAMIGNN